MSFITQSEVDSFQFSEEEFKELYKEKPWRDDPKYFSSVKISVTATIKMLRHALKGVADGRARSGAPVEIMGLLVGKLQRGSLVVTDVMPLPVEGIEYQVTAKDDALALAARMADLMEERRHDRFIGWYHSHPFDVAPWSHCHLSATDCQTQAQWQFMTPWWIALVLDPLRSLVQQVPELGVYRCYPPELTPTTAPDGTALSAAPSTQIVRRWGNSHHRYYQMQHTFFTSGPSARLYNAASAPALWRVALTASPGAAPTAAAEAAEALHTLADRVSTRHEDAPAVSRQAVAVLCHRANVRPELSALHAPAPGALLAYALAVCACIDPRALPSREGMAAAVEIVRTLPNNGPLRDAVACAQWWIQHTQDAPDMLVRIHALNMSESAFPQAVAAAIALPFEAGRGECRGDALSCVTAARAHALQRTNEKVLLGMRAATDNIADQINVWQDKYNCCANNGFMKQLMLAVVQRSADAANLHSSIQVINE